GPHDRDRRAAAGALAGTARPPPAPAPPRLPAWVDQAVLGAVRRDVPRLPLPWEASAGAPPVARGGPVALRAPDARPGLHLLGLRLGPPPGLARRAGGRWGDRPHEA